jgi:hypothetical protein
MRTWLSSLEQLQCAGRGFCCQWLASWMRCDSCHGSERRQTNAEDAKVSLRARRVPGFDFAAFAFFYVAAFAFRFLLNGV